MNPTAVYSTSDKIRNLRDENRETTNRMLSVVSQTEDVARNNLVVVETQNEQLDAVSAGLDEVQRQTGQAKKLVHGMGSIFSPFKNIFGKKHKEAPVSSRTHKESSRAMMISDLSLPGLEQHRFNRQRTLSLNENCFRTQTPPPEVKRQSDISDLISKEESENLDQIGLALKRLREYARISGEQLEVQHKKMDVIEERVEDADYEMKDINVRVKKYL